MLRPQATLTCWRRCQLNIFRKTQQPFPAVIWKEMLLFFLDKFCLYRQFLIISYADYFFLKIFFSNQSISLQKISLAKIGIWLKPNVKGDLPWIQHKVNQRQRKQKEGEYGSEFLGLFISLNAKYQDEFHIMGWHQWARFPQRRRFLQNYRAAQFGRDLESLLVQPFMGKGAWKRFYLDIMFWKPPVMRILPHFCRHCSSNWLFLL